MISQTASRRGIRLIAVFEATKGAFAFLAGCGMLALLHQNLGRLALNLITLLHLNPSHKYPRLFIELSSSASDMQLWLFSGLAFVYAAFRLLEGYGLWRERTWAEWVAFLSGTIYLPLEIYELSQKLSWFRISILLANVAIVIFMAQILWRSLQQRRLRFQHHEPGGPG